jgi:hypothetical protein
VFVKDTFSGAVAGSNLTAHTGEIGATWTNHASSPTSSILVSSTGTIYGTTLGAANLYYASGVPASADYSVFADVVVKSLINAASVCGRVNTGALTYYLAILDGSNISLYKRVAGTFTLLATTTAALSSGSTYRLGLHMSGTVIKATLNGVVYLAAGDAAIAAAGRAGVQLDSTSTDTTGLHIDNFVGSYGLFWIGGNGNTSDAAHWSRVPVGTGGVTPASTDDMYVGPGSGSPTVTVDASITFSSITMGTPGVYAPTTETMILTGTGTNTIGDTGDLTVYGDAGFGASLSSMTLTGTTAWYQYSSSYIPKLTLGSTGVLVCGHTPNGIVQCNATTLLYTGTGSLTLPLLDVNDAYASLNVGTFDLTLANASSDVIFGNSVMGSEMYVSEKLDLNGSAPLTNLDRLVVYFDGGSTTANLGGKTLGAIHVNSGKCTIAGDNVANSLILEKDTAINMSGSCTFGYIAVASNMSIVIGAGKTLTGRLVIQNYNEVAKNVSISSGTAGTLATWNLNNSGPITKSRWRVQDISFTNGSIIAYHSTDLGNNLGITFNYGLEKTYRYAVYDFAGTYISEYTDVVSDPDFTRQVNAPPGQMTIRREVDPTNYGEGTIVDYDNKVIVTCISDDHPNGVVIYTGAIESWTPNIEPGNGYVDILLMPYGADLVQFPVTDQSLTDVSFVQSQPKTLLNFTSSKLAISWTTGLGVVAIGQVFMPINFINTSSITVKIYKDNGSNTPDNTTAVYTTTYTVNNTSVPQSVNALIPNIAASASSKYWIVADVGGGSIVPNTVYTTNDYASGNAAYWNGASWVQSAAYGIDYLTTYTAVADTTVAYSAADLKESLTGLLDVYAILGGRITYSDASIDDPGVDFTYTFNSNTMLDAAQKFIDQCPAGWFWYIDPATNLFHLHPQPTTPRHTFTIGVDVEKVQLQKTKGTIVNSLFVTGGDTGGGVNLFRNYVNIPSIGRYRRRTKFYNDVNLTDSTAADAVGQKIIGQSKDPTSRAPVTVLSAPDVGADIEIINPGDLFVILGKDNTLEHLQVGSFNYSGVKAEIDASSAPPQINATLNDTQVAVRQQQNVNNPATATVVEVL